jgi:iron complex outermembrane receptor protein
MVSSAHRALIGRGLLASCASVLLIVAGQSVTFGADDSFKHFEITAKPLADALMEFGVQSGLTVVAPTTLTAGKKATSVRGDLPPSDALGRLLKGSGLTFARAADGTISIQAISSSDPVQASVRESRLERELTADMSLSEVVVTANKLTAQSVLDAPVSIQAISGDAIQAAGSSAIMDIAGQIPGLSIQDLGPGDKKYVIRGINSSGDLTTGVYYGEATISGSNANDGGGFESDIRLYDLDHVEVLRGPQGTLYGASSMSGTIRFIPKAPDLGSIGGYLTANASYTEHASSNSNVNGALNLPIIDGVLGLRVVGWHVDDSGFINQIRVGSGMPEATPFELKHVNNDDVEGERVILRYKPTENFTLDLNYTSQTETSGGSSRYTPPGVTALSAPGAIPPVQGCDYCNTDVTQSLWRDDLQVYGFTATEKTQHWHHHGDQQSVQPHDPLQL